MKRFSWRGAVAALLVSQAGFASAQSTGTPQPVNDATRMTWEVTASDSDVLDFAAVVKAQVTVLAPATTPYYPEVEGAEPVGVTVYFPAVSTAHDAVTGLATAVASAGSVQISTSRISGFQTGGTLTLSNWGIDVASRQLNADISGTLGLPSQNQVAVFTLGEPVVTGASTSFSLWLTQAGADAFAQATGLKGLGLVALQNVRAHSFGTLSVDVAAVPEPSNAVLVLAGLSAVAVAARRRRQPAAGAQPA